VEVQFIDKNRIRVSKGEEGEGKKKKDGLGGQWEGIMHKVWKISGDS